MSKGDLDLILSMIEVELSWHSFNLGQGHAMSGQNYHIGAITALSSLSYKIAKEYEAVA